MYSGCSAVNGNWGGWSSWSSCENAADLKTRTRQCDNPTPYCGGASCSGSITDTALCGKFSGQTSGNCPYNKSIKHFCNQRSFIS